MAIKQGETGVENPTAVTNSGETPYAEYLKRDEENVERFVGSPTAAAKDTVESARLDMTVAKMLESPDEYLPSEHQAALEELNNRYTMTNQALVNFTKNVGGEAVQPAELLRMYVDKMHQVADILSAPTGPRTEEAAKAFHDQRWNAAMQFMGETFGDKDYLDTQKAMQGMSREEQAAYALDWLNKNEKIDYTEEDERAWLAKGGADASDAEKMRWLASLDDTAKAKGAWDADLVARVEATLKNDAALNVNSVERHGGKLHYETEFKDPAEREYAEVARARNKWVHEQRILDRMAKAQQNERNFAAAMEVVPFMSDAQKSLVAAAANGTDMDQYRGIFKLMDEKTRHTMEAVCNAVRPETEAGFVSGLEMGGRRFGNAITEFTTAMYYQAVKDVTAQDELAEEQKFNRDFNTMLGWDKLKDPSGWWEKAWTGLGESMPLQGSAIGGALAFKAAAKMTKHPLAKFGLMALGTGLESMGLLSMAGDEYENLTLNGVSREDAIPLAFAAGIGNWMIENMNTEMILGTGLSANELMRIGMISSAKAGARCFSKKSVAEFGRAALQREFMETLRTNAAAAFKIALSENFEEFCQGIVSKGTEKFAKGEMPLLTAFIDADTIEAGAQAFKEAMPTCTLFGLGGAAFPAGSWFGFKQNNARAGAMVRMDEQLEALLDEKVKNLGLDVKGEEFVKGWKDTQRKIIENRAAQIVRGTDGMAPGESTRWLNQQGDMTPSERAFYADMISFYSAARTQVGAVAAKAYADSNLQLFRYEAKGAKVAVDPESGKVTGITFKDEDGDVTIGINDVSAEKVTRELLGPQIVSDFIKQWNEDYPEEAFKTDAAAMDEEELARLDKALEKGVNGFYSPSTKTITLTSNAYGATLAHEGGHATIWDALQNALDKQTNLSRTAIRRIKTRVEQELGISSANDEATAKLVEVKAALGGAVHKDATKYFESMDFGAAVKNVGRWITNIFRSGKERTPYLPVLRTPEVEGINPVELVKEVVNEALPVALEAEKARRTVNAEDKARGVARRGGNAEEAKALRQQKREAKMAARKVQWQAIAAKQWESAEEKAKAEQDFWNEIDAEIEAEEAAEKAEVARREEAEMAAQLKEEEAAEREEERKNAKMLANRKKAVKTPPKLKAANGKEATPEGSAAYQAAWRAKTGKVITQEEVDQLGEKYGLPPEALNLKKTDKGYVLTDKQMLSDESLAKLADGLTRFYRDLTSVRIQVPDVVVANADEAANVLPNEVYDPVSDTFIEGRVVIDADRAKTFREEAGMEEPSVSPEEIEAARQRRSAQRRVPSGQQKDAQTDYPSAADEIRSYQFSIGKKAREDAKALIIKKRMDLIANSVRAAVYARTKYPNAGSYWRDEKIYSDVKDYIANFYVDEIAKFPDTKSQKAALHWFINGSIVLPEDAPKVTEALKCASRAKGKANTDPMSYASPMAMIEALHEFKPKANRIDPDKVPQLSDRREMWNGVVTYLVQDDREGQQAMREIINTHWGEDANPWCLLHGDGHGHLSDGTDGGYDAWYYWNHYNALPKRVAFKDGRLLAFMATDENSGGYPRDDYQDYLDENGLTEEDIDFDTWQAEEYHHVPEKWWDRLDDSHEGIPLGNIPVPGDAFGRWADFEIRDGKAVQIGGFQKIVNGAKVIEWFANGMKHYEAGNPYLVWDEDGSLMTYKDKKENYSFKDGKLRDLRTTSGRREMFLDKYGREIGVNANDNWNVLTVMDGGLRIEDLVSVSFDSATKEFVEIDEGGNVTRTTEDDPRLSEYQHRAINLAREEMEKHLADAERIYREHSQTTPRTQFSLVTPSEDAAYADAVKRGDRESALRMIREAAAKAMPNAAKNKDGLPKIIYTLNPLDVPEEYSAWNSSLPPEAAKEVASWGVISKSPYSDSFYNAKGITWESKPDGSLRVADHWNFWSRGKQHCQTTTQIENGKWAMGRYDSSTGKYTIVKTWDKGDADYFTRQANQRKQEVQLQESNASRIRESILDVVDKETIQGLEKRIGKKIHSPVRNGILREVGKNEHGAVQITVEVLPSHKMQTFSGYELNELIGKLERAGDIERADKSSFSDPNVTGNGIFLDPTTGQTKSADITYDDAGNLIPLSQRFNANTPDIRFSLGNGENNALTVWPGEREDGTEVDFVDEMLNHHKLWETRTHAHLIQQPVGIGYGGVTKGRVQFGKPTAITRHGDAFTFAGGVESEAGNYRRLYDESLIAGTDYDMDDGETRWFYPVTVLDDYREFPRPMMANGVYQKYPATPATRFSLFLGEEGAKRFEENGKIVQDLAVARQALAGRDWRDLTRDEKVKIKLATGWEVGADGKWRYEAPDLKNPFGTSNSEKLSQLIKEDEQVYEAYRNCVQRMNEMYRAAKEDALKKEGDDDPFTVKKYIDTDQYEVFRNGYNEYWKEHLQLQRKIRAAKFPKRKYTVRDFAEGTMLEKAYPDLMDTPISIKVLGRRRAGKVDNRGITIDPDQSVFDAFRTVTHEVQHLIQRQEGFARGGNVKFDGDAGYHRLAGEVEARNAEWRLEGPISEIEALIEDTEDVARDSQIILHDFYTSAREILSQMQATRFSISNGEWDKLESHFGVTDNALEAGWIDPRGKMIDFSGAHWTADRRAPNPGHRQVDHADVKEVLSRGYDANWLYRWEMLEAGAIRTMPEMPSLGVAHDITEAQEDAIYDWVDWMQGKSAPIMVEYYADEMRSTDFQEFAQGTSARAIIDAIHAHYEDKGVDHTQFSIRRDPPPTKTGIGYKAFVQKDGKLYPPMVANPGGADTPVGVWLDADEGVRAEDSKTGRKKVKAGGKGTNGGSSTLAWRPGWHLGEIPYALQFNVGEKVPNPLGITNKKGEVIEVGKYFPANFVWAEVEYAADNDYQKEAESYGYNAAGNFRHAFAGLPHLPVDGSYRYRTNPNPATDPWIITGAMRVNKVLTNEEVDDLVRAAGREPQLRERPETNEMKYVPATRDEATEGVKKASAATGMTRFSVSSGASAAGLIYETDKNGRLKIVLPNGRRVTTKDPVTMEDLLSIDSPLMHLINLGIAKGTIGRNKGEGERIKRNIAASFAECFNLAAKWGDTDDGVSAVDAMWRWVGDETFKAIKSNSDSQYGTSVDMLTICKKTDMLMQVVSDYMKKLKRGAMPTDIMNLYLETGKAAFQTPCPVCYVFSRWIRAGYDRQTAWEAQKRFAPLIKKHDPSTKEGKAFWKSEYEKWAIPDGKKRKPTAEQKARAKAIGEAKQVMTLGYQQFDAAIAKGDQAEAQRINREMERAFETLRTADLAGFIKYCIYDVEEDTAWNDFKTVPSDILFDFRAAAEISRHYPALRRFYGSKGSAGGKAIETEANNDFGDIVVGIANDGKVENNPLKVAFSHPAGSEERKAALAEFSAQFETALAKSIRQNLIGGQRFLSWSDNRVEMGFDMMMNLLQIQILGNSIQSYSKQLEGAELLAKHGAYNNGSLMGAGNGLEPAKKGEPGAVKLDGKWVKLKFSDIQGINHEQLFALNKMYDKSGNILVGMNDDHIRVALRDERIFFIIPWHASGLGHGLLDYMLTALGEAAHGTETDYSAYQKEKFLEDGNCNTETLLLFERSSQEGKKFKSCFKVEHKPGIITKSQRRYRKLRERLLLGTATKADVAVAMKDEFLSQIVRDLREGAERLGGKNASTTYVNKNCGIPMLKMTKDDTEAIYPYEYWDRNSTYKNASVNSARYLEFCRRLGVLPKFCGLSMKKGKPTRGAYGDFTNEANYWKLLIDRRMYAISGKYQHTDQVEMATEDRAFDVDTINPVAIEKKWGKLLTKKASPKQVGKIVDSVILRQVKQGYSLVKPVRPGAKTNRFSLNNDNAEKVAALIGAVGILKGEALTDKTLDAIRKSTRASIAIPDLRREAERLAAENRRVLNYIAHDKTLDKVIARAGKADRLQKVIDRSRQADLDFATGIQKKMDRVNRANERVIRDTKGLTADVIFNEMGIDPASLLLSLRPAETAPAVRTAPTAAEQTADMPHALDANLMAAAQQRAQELIGKARDAVAKAKAEQANNPVEIDEDGKRQAKANADAGDPDVAIGTMMQQAIEEEVKKSGITIDNPAEMVKLAEVITEDYIRNHQDLYQGIDLANIWEDPRARALLGGNISRFAQMTADAYCPTFTRERVAKKAQMLDDKAVRKLETIEEIGVHMFEDLNRDIVRESRKAIIRQIHKKIDTLARNHEENALNLDRKVTSALSAYLKKVKKAIDMTSTQVEDRINELENLCTSRYQGVDEETANHYRDYQEAQDEIYILSYWGNLKQKMPSELKADYEYLDQLVNEDLARMMAQREEYIRHIDETVAAMVGGIAPDPKNKGKKPTNDPWAYSVVGMFEAKYRQYLRFCKDPAKAQAAREAFAQIEQMINDSTAAETNFIIEFREKMKAVIEEAYGSVDKARQMLTEEFDAPWYWVKLPGDTNPQVEDDVGVTAKRALQMYVSIVQDDYIENVEKWGRNGEYRAKLERMLGIVDENGNYNADAPHAKFVEGLRALYLEMGERLDEILVETTGTHLRTPNRNYMPVKMDRRIKRGKNGEGRAFSPFAPSLTPRIKNGRDFDQTADIVDIFLDRLSDTAHTIGWAKTGPLVMKIAQSDAVINTIENNFGDAEARRWNNYIFDIVAGPKASNVRETKAMKATMRYASLLWLGLNLGSWAKQLTSIPCLAMSNEVTLRDVAAGAGMWVLKPIQMCRAAYDLANSEAFKSRYGTAISNELRYAITDDGGFATWKSRLVKGIMSGVVGADKLGVLMMAGIYFRRRQQLEQQGHTAEESADLAANWMMAIVDKTMQSGRTINLTEAQRNGGLAAFLQFKSAPMQQAQFEMVAYEEWAADKTNGEKFRNLVKTIVVNHIAVPFGMAIVDAAMAFLTSWGVPDEEKRQRLFARIVGEILGGPFSSLFLIGGFVEYGADVISQLVTGSTSKYGTGVGQLIPAEGAIEFMAKNAEDFVKALETIPQGEYLDTAVQMGLAIGNAIPGASWLTRTGKKIHDAVTEDPAAKAKRERNRARRKAKAERDKARKRK